MTCILDNIVTRQMRLGYSSQGRASKNGLCGAGRFGASLKT